MITPGEIGWGSYLQWEGPWFKGRKKVQDPGPLAPLDRRLMYVITATEGGTYDAINMYDRCVCTVGAIQWCENGVMAVSDLLHRAGQSDSWVWQALKTPMQLSGAVFVEDSQGRGRFAIGGDLVDTTPEIQRLYFGAPGVGPRGTWTAQSQGHARTWAAALASVWDSEACTQAQASFTSEKLMNFVAGEAKDLFEDGLDGDWDGYRGAAKAIYLSYAANNPSIALAQYKRFRAATKAVPYSPSWVAGLAYRLAFGPQIKLYPERYDKIRPAVERMFQVDLPDFSRELAQASMSPTAKQVQSALIARGFDLGPSGADGIVGGKTKAALVQFQSQNGLTPTGQPDQATIAALGF